MKEVFEECGIAGIYLKNNYKNKEKVPSLLYSMLFQLQHRGQLSAGISTYNLFNRGYEKRLKLLKEVGKVNDLFKTNNVEENKKLLKYYRGIAGIGHVRYATAGSATTYRDLFEEAQPLVRQHGRPWKRFSIAFNGNLANYSILRKEISKEGYLLDTKVDTEIIMHLFSLNLKKLSKKNKSGKDIKPDLLEVSKAVMEKLDGAYNLVMLFGDGDLFVLRDPLGFKPLVYGENSKCFAVASESIALEQIEINNFYPVEPGNGIIFNRKGVIEKKIIDSKRRAHCQFERVYFSKANSIIDNKSVDSTRISLGKKLAEIEPLKNKFSKGYVVVPVPKTAIPAAEAYSQELRLPLTLVLDKVEGKRGFINKKGEREKIIGREYIVIADRIKGKKVILIEDSIVRGETSKKVIQSFKKAGAKEVHLRSTEPPIKFPCFYGIDFPTYTELIASKYLNCSKKNLEKKVANYIGADSVVYQTLDGLIKATGFQRNELCLACLTGEYPTPAGAKMAEKAL